MNGQKVVVGLWYRLGTVAANYFTLNLLFLVTALGIVTLPPSLAAVMGTVIKWSETGDESVISMYFSEWKRLARKSYAVITPVLVITIILLLEWWFYAWRRDPVSVIMLGLTIGFSLIYISVSSYIMLLFVRYDLPIRRLVTVAFYLGIRYWGRTVIRVVPVSLAIIVLAISLPALFLLGSVVPVYCWYVYRTTKKTIQYSIGQYVTDYETP